jgi:RHS repeat-associated protein
MPGRLYNGANYRHGFNGKENDNEIKGTGNQQDYGLRIYDTRLGKFLSVDPLYRQYPWNSNYAFAENSPIENLDLDGAEKRSYVISLRKAQAISKTDWTFYEGGHGPLGDGLLVTIVDDKGKYQIKMYVKNIGEIHPSKYLSEINSEVCRQVLTLEENKSKIDENAKKIEDIDAYYEQLEQSYADSDPENITSDAQTINSIVNVVKRNKEVEVINSETAKLENENKEIKEEIGLLKISRKAHDLKNERIQPKKTKEKDPIHIEKPMY